MAYTTITVEIVQTIPLGGSFITTFYGEASWFQRGLATPSPATTTVEVILSDQTGLHTTLQEVTFTPTLRHGLVPPSFATIARRKPHEQPEQETDRTTISGTRSLSPSTVQTAPPTPSLSSSTPATHAPSFTTTTVTRSHPPAFTSTHTSYVDQWPQIGRIVSESDVPQQWRETYEMKALRQQYIAFGGICSIFVIGVLGVLALGWWKCWTSAGSREEGVEQGQKWDWF